LQRHFTECSVAFDQSVTIDPATLLPKWLQPRKTG
jgi:hypothetical protein